MNNNSNKESVELYEAPPISGEKVPFKDLENNETLNVSANTNNLTEPKKAKKTNKPIFIFASLLFIIITLLFFSLSVKPSSPKTTPKPIATQTNNIEATGSAVPQDIVDLHNSIFKAIKSEDFDEYKIYFPIIDWEISL